MKPEKTAPVLAITPNEQIFLPKCYHRIQDICAVIYDQLTEIYKEKKLSGLISYRVNFRWKRDWNGRTE